MSRISSPQVCDTHSNPRKNPPRSALSPYQTIGKPAANPASPASPPPKTALRICIFSPEHMQKFCIDEDEDEDDLKMMMMMMMMKMIVV